MSMTNQLSSEEYQRKMQKRKQVQNQRLAQMKAEKGLIFPQTSSYE